MFKTKLTFCLFIPLLGSTYYTPLSRIISLLNTHPKWTLHWNEQILSHRNHLKFAVILWLLTVHKTLRHDHIHNVNCNEPRVPSLHCMLESFPSPPPKTTTASDLGICSSLLTKLSTGWGIQLACFPVCFLSLTGPICFICYWCDPLLTVNKDILFIRKRSQNQAQIFVQMNSILKKDDLHKI